MPGRIALLILALVFLTGQQPLRSRSKGSPNGFDLVDKTGNICKPADFRDLYQALGVYTAVSLNNDIEMHYTYALPGTAAARAYCRTQYPIVPLFTRPLPPARVTFRLRLARHAYGFDEQIEFQLRAL